MKAQVKKKLVEVINCLEKVFCSTGPGGGVDPTCGSGGGGSGTSMSGEQKRKIFKAGK